MTITCLVGLGNPGASFDNTRHNLGKRFVLWLVDRCSGQWKKEPLLWHASIVLPNGQKLVCIIPQTYMNESGKIASFLKKISTELESILVVHDDLELDFGVHAFRFSPERGLRGHNGLRSLQKCLGGKPYFLSLGIGRPNREEVHEYVLKKFSHEEECGMIAAFEKAEAILFAA